MPEKDPGTGELKEAEEGLRTILPPRDDAPPVVEPREHAPDRGQHARTGRGVEGLRGSRAAGCWLSPFSGACRKRMRYLVTRLLRRRHSRPPVLPLSRWVRLTKSSMSDTA